MNDILESMARPDWNPLTWIDRNSALAFTDPLYKASIAEEVLGKARSAGLPTEKLNELQKYIDRQRAPPTYLRPG